MEDIRLHFVDSHRGTAEFLNDFILLYTLFHSLSFPLPRFVLFSHAVASIQYQHVVIALP
jgi:hypothetical protein